MKKMSLYIMSAALFCAFAATSCKTTRNVFRSGAAATQQWVIAHQPQIEQTAFVVARSVGQDAVKLFLGGYQDSKFSFAAGVRSLEGNYVSPDQITGLVGVWSPNTPAFNQAAATIAADLANHPPANKDQAVARLEGYIAGIAPGMGVPAAQQPVLSSVPILTPPASKPAGRSAGRLEGP